MRVSCRADSFSLGWSHEWLHIAVPSARKGNLRTPIQRRPQSFLLGLFTLGRFSGMILFSGAMVSLCILNILDMVSLMSLSESLQSWLILVGLLFSLIELGGIIYVIPSVFAVFLLCWSSIFILSLPGRLMEGFGFVLLFSFFTWLYPVTGNRSWIVWGMMKRTGVETGIMGTY